jgi:hypothetical protein
MADTFNNISPFSPRKAGTLEEKLKSNESFTPVEKLMVYQTLSRHWRKALTPSEFVVLSYIVDRSVGWGNAYFTACADNVLMGAGEYSGVGVSRTSYYRALTSLEKMGAITRKSLRDRTRIWLHLDWFDRH